MVKTFKGGTKSVLNALTSKKGGWGVRMREEGGVGDKKKDKE